MNSSTQIQNAINVGKVSTPNKYLQRLISIFICIITLCTRAYSVNFVRLLCFVMGCDCQLITKENDDNDDDDETE